MPGKTFGRFSGATLITIMTQTALAQLSFTPTPGYSATPLWQGADAAHFAINDDSLFLYGAEDIGGGQEQLVVRQVSGGNTNEVARSTASVAGTFFPDAVTAVNSAVYWVAAESYVAGGEASLYKSSFDGSTWTTTQIFDPSAGISVFSLSTNGDRTFGTGLNSAGVNVAFYLDATDDYQVLAELPADASGGSGFAPNGDFFAGAWSVSGDYASHMYRFSAQQLAERASGAHATPYAAGDALADLIVPGNGSAVMESDGLALYGTQYNSNYTGLNPYAYDPITGVSTELGVLSGAATTVAADMYARDGRVLFLGKDDWSTGSEAVIYELVPEPASLALLGIGVLASLRRRAV